jgi:prepilin-type N-terminal cleavage/methylation domain-containing protein
MKAPVASLGFSTGNPATDARPGRAFTLIEIMVVVSILGVILTMGAPPFFRILQKEGMRKAVSELQDVCSNARAQAIMKGSTAEIVFHPVEGRFEAVGVESGTPLPSPTSGSGRAGRLPDGFKIEMLDINFLEYCESEVARVRFFPNGTSDEMTLILRSDNNERRAITLEVTTGLASVESDPQKFGRQ